MIAGSFAGRRLSDMDMDELIQLYSECTSQDPQSATVLATYLDRTLGSEWRAATDGIDPDSHEVDSSGSGMDRYEALQILGLEEGATEREIKQAHKRLMQKLHPDQGGSNRQFDGRLE